MELVEKVLVEVKKLEEEVETSGSETVRHRVGRLRALCQEEYDRREAAFHEWATAER